MTLRFRNPQLLWLSALIIALDQLSKWLIEQRIPLYEVVTLTEVLNFTHLRNTGAAFSMMAGLPPAFFIVLGSAVSLGIVWWLRRHAEEQRLVALALACILGGALGNVIDRVVRGAVVDFVDFHIGNWHYAAFNVADVAITVGAFLLILDMVLDWYRHRGTK